MRSLILRNGPFLVLFSSLYCLSTLHAQTTATEILGLVKDSSGAVLSGAAITITRVATGLSLTKTTDQTGEYAFPLLEIGQYTVHAEMQGFRSQTVTELKLETQQKARVDFVLYVGSVTESVAVVASGAVLETESATVGQVIENKRISDLPLNGRNLIHLAAMVPGVQYGSRSGGADGQGGFPIPGGGMSIIANGQREVHQSITLDRKPSVEMHHVRGGGQVQARTSGLEMKHEEPHRFIFLEAEQRSCAFSLQLRRAAPDRAVRRPNRTG